MNFLARIGTVIVGVFSVAGGVGSFAQWAGFEFNGIVGSIVSASPLWLPLASLLFGTAIGWWARGRSQTVTKSERRRIKEQEQELRKKNLENAKRSFYELDPDLKAIMLAALDKGGAYCDGNEWKFSRLPENEFISQFVETRYIDGNVAKITASPLLEEFRKSVPDAFEGVSMTLDKHARDRGSKSFAMFSTSYIDWWWYR